MTPDHPTDLGWLQAQIASLERRLDASAPICERTAVLVWGRSFWGRLKWLLLGR